MSISFKVHDLHIKMVISHSHSPSSVRVSADFRKVDGHISSVSNDNDVAVDAAAADFNKFSTRFNCLENE